MEKEVETNEKKYTIIGEAKCIDDVAYINIKEDKIYKVIAKEKYDLTIINDENFINIYPINLFTDIKLYDTLESDKFFEWAKKSKKEIVKEYQEIQKNEKYKDLKYYKCWLDELKVTVYPFAKIEKNCITFEVEPISEINVKIKDNDNFEQVIFFNDNLRLISKCNEEEAKTKFASYLTNVIKKSGV